MEVPLIILVDDDPDDRAILIEAFEEISRETILKIADNGEELLALLDQEYTRDEIPSLIILDLNMPRLNGTQTLNLLKTNDRFENIPVVIYSTSVNPMEKERCIQLGAHSYITKPVTYDESVETAKKFLMIAKG